MGELFAFRLQLKHFLLLLLLVRCHLLSELFHGGINFGSFVLQILNTSISSLFLFKKGFNCSLGIIDCSISIRHFFFETTNLFHCLLLGGGQIDNILLHFIILCIKVVNFVFVRLLRIFHIPPQFGNISLSIIQVVLQVLNQFCKILLLRSQLINCPRKTHRHIINLGLVILSFFCQLICQLAQCNIRIFQISLEIIYLLHQRILLLQQCIFVIVDTIQFILQ